jgi:hypothetical protein
MSEGLHGVLVGLNGGHRNLPRVDTGRTADRTEKPYEQVAVDFATALVAGQFARASEMLTPALRREMTPHMLQEALNGMCAYSPGKPKRIHFDPQHSMENWPDKQPDDVGLTYVSISGDDFNEAVTVIVANVGGRHLIREIEWGRP